MNHYLCASHPHEDQVFAKIDNDTMVPPGWLEECLRVLHRAPELALLGIEAMYTPAVATHMPDRYYKPARFIGGIGLMRSGAFTTLPRPSGTRFGFTAWQEESTKVVKGWIDPAIPVFLLDRLPREPWLTYSKEYVRQGWQRPWPCYEDAAKDLWSWWTP